MRFNKALAVLAVAIVAALWSAPAFAESALTTSDGKTSTDSKQESDKKDKEPKNDKKDVIVTVAEGDSLSLIAEANGTTWTRLFDANESIINLDTINPGDKIRVPAADEQLTDRTSAALAAQRSARTQAAPVPVARRNTYTTHQYTSKPVSSSSYYIGNGMWCTDYVHSRRPDVAVYGNAGYNWINAAQRAGKSTGTTPQAGAVAVTNGHVAYVESVNADGSYTVSEMGWNYKAGNYNKRTVRSGTFGQFIY